MRILVRPGFKLNPNEKIVKGIIKAIERNEGKCPCVHEEPCDDPICPCSDYRLKNKCCCQLYIKEV